MTAAQRRGWAAGAVAAGSVAAPALLLTAFPPPALQPRLWVLLPGWGYAADGLSVGLAALLLLLAGLAGAQTVQAPPPPTGRARQGVGGALLLLALAQTVFAANLGGRWLGLEIAGGALWLLAPGTPRAAVLLRHLAGYPLLAVALSGLLDAPHPPGQVIPALPAWLVIALLLSALVRLATLAPPLVNPKSRTYNPDQPPTPNPQPLILYAAVAFYPLVRSLAAGPWDTWGRFAVVALALILLGVATAYCVLRIAYPQLLLAPTSHLTPHAPYLLGAVLLGLGLGSAAGVSGALALGAAGLAGAALAAGAAGVQGGDGAALRVLGRLSVLGLPPVAGFAGLWLLGGALLPARYPLGLILLLVLAALLVGNGGGGSAREAADQSAVRSPYSALPLLPLAAVLLLGGLAPAVWLDGLIRPAANTLAAGVPALSTVFAVPGLGYAAGPDTAPIAAWPVLGVSVAVALAWAAVELGARLIRQRSREPGAGSREPHAPSPPDLQPPTPNPQPPAR